MDRNGIIALQRGKIAVTGDDRVRWMHGMVTNDVKGLLPGSGCYCFVLDAQGRIQADCNVYMEADRLIVDCEAFLTGKLIRLLDKFIIMDQVELTDISETMPTLAVIGADAKTIKAPGAIVYPTPLGVMIWGDAPAIPDTVSIAADEYETLRIERGVPRYGTDIDDTTIPNETGQMQAMHFNKGCYIGQEIVERVRSRGHVNRIFTGFCADSEIAAPATFDTGRTTSAVFSPRLKHWIGLGYVRREHSAPGTKVTTTTGVPLEVCSLPFAIPG
jgi:folate-binding protein YgfZ